MFQILVVCSLTWLSSTKCADFDHPAIYQLTEPVDHAEEPTWDERKNMLYYVDMIAGGIYSYNYETSEVNSIHLDGAVAPVIPSEHDENLLIVGLNQAVLALEWDGTNQIGRQKVLANISQEFPTSRVNEGKADKEGRLWIGTTGTADSSGTMTPNAGIVYKITKESLDRPTVEIAPVNISNGLAWNAANDKFYYVDSLSFQIAQYDYDNELGTISNRQVAFDMHDYPEITGQPDGMTIDEDDNLWVAMYYGGVVLKINPTERALLQVIGLPARDITSTMWGGPNLDILFVTSSRLSLTDEEKLYYPAAGSLFAITNLKTKGRPVFNVDLIESI
uniref:Regucalcin n=1 Tax=Dendroctonus ponderosae TaxID=77166 RepID=A0AAR5QI87_DENPD